MGAIGRVERTCDENKQRRRPTSATNVGDIQKSALHREIKTRRTGNPCFQTKRLLPTDYQLVVNEFPKTATAFATAATHGRLMAQLLDETGKKRITWCSANELVDEKAQLDLSREMEIVLIDEDFTATSPSIVSDVVVSDDNDTEHLVRLEKMVQQLSDQVQTLSSQMQWLMLASKSGTPSEKCNGEICVNCSACQDMVKQDSADDWVDILS